MGGSPLFMDYARLMVPALVSKCLHFLPLELLAWKDIYGRNASRDSVTTGMAGAEVGFPAQPTQPDHMMYEHCKGHLLLLTAHRLWGWDKGKLEEVTGQHVCHPSI